jgi:hypothetical protein
MMSGRVTLDAVLLVLAILDPALDVDLAALLQVLAGDLAEAPVQRDPVPLGLFLLLAALVLPRLGRRDGDVGDRIAVRQVARLGIAAQVADQNRLCSLKPCFRRSCRKSSLIIGRSMPAAGLSARDPGLNR